jgi:hypothetical protein
MASVLRLLFSASALNSAPRNGVGQGAGGVLGRGAGDAIGGADGQPQLVGHGLEAVGLLVHPVGEGVGQFGELLLRALRAQLVLQLGALLLEGRHLAGLMPVNSMMW